MTLTLLSCCCSFRMISDFGLIARAYPFLTEASYRGPSVWLRLGVAVAITGSFNPLFSEPLRSLALGSMFGENILLLSLFFSLDLRSVAWRERSSLVATDSIVSKRFIWVGVAITDRKSACRVCLRLRVYARRITSFIFCSSAKAFLLDLSSSFSCFSKS